MASISENISSIKSTLPQNTRLVAVSKFHPTEAVMEAYNAGQRIFGENRPQELAAKSPVLPSDIQWHFIGHLQTNKLKMVLPHAYMIQSVDSLKLLQMINSWAEDNHKTLRCLLELHLGAEESKHGLSEDEIVSILDNAKAYPAVVFCGLMGMATNTDDQTVIRGDFARISNFMKDLKARHPELTDFSELSIGMSHDYKIALEYGATMVRIGTGIFGPREY